MNSTQKHLTFFAYLRQLAMNIIKPKQLRNYVTTSGKVPFSDWLLGLKDPVTRARIRQRLDRLSLGQYGDYKSVGDGVYELRLAFGSGYRIYFAQTDDELVILLCAGDKSTQEKDVRTAKLYWNDLKYRSDEENKAGDTK